MWHPPSERAIEKVKPAAERRALFREKADRVLLDLEVATLNLAAVIGPTAPVLPAIRASGDLIRQLVAEISKK